MTKEELQHVENNIESFRAWIGVEAALQESDITLPIFQAYERETKLSTTACSNCKLDALRWAIKELKESQNPKTDEGKTTKKK